MSECLCWLNKWGVSSNRPLNRRAHLCFMQSLPVFHLLSCNDFRSLSTSTWALIVHCRLVSDTTLISKTTSKWRKPCVMSIEYVWCQDTAWARPEAKPPADPYEEARRTILGGVNHVWREWSVCDARGLIRIECVTPGFSSELLPAEHFILAEILPNQQREVHRPIPGPNKVLT